LGRGHLKNNQETFSETLEAKTKDQRRKKEVKRRHGEERRISRKSSPQEVFPINHDRRSKIP